MNDATSADIINPNDRLETANRKLLAALRKAGAKVGKPDKQNRFMRDINGVPTFISFYLAGTFAAPTADMRLSMGERNGRRLMLREPKRGFDFAMCAQRVIAYTREKGEKLARVEASKKIEETNRFLARKLHNKHKLAKYPISVHRLYNEDRAGFVCIETRTEGLSEAQANKLIVSLKKLMPPANRNRK